MLLMIGCLLSIGGGVACHITVNRNSQLGCIISAVASNLGIGMIISALLDKWLL